MAPPAAGQLGNNLQAPPAFSIECGTAGHRCDVVLPSAQRIKDFADQFPPPAHAPKVNPHLRRAREWPRSNVVGFDVVMRVQRVGGEFACHGHPVVDELLGKPENGRCLPEYPPGLGGAGRIQWKLAGTTPANGQRRGSCQRSRTRGALDTHVPGTVASSVRGGPSPPSARDVRGTWWRRGERQSSDGRRR